LKEPLEAVQKGIQVVEKLPSAPPLSQEERGVFARALRFPSRWTGGGILALIHRGDQHDQHILLDGL
jgi:hypothetical protein